METRSISFLLGFIFICLMTISLVSVREVGRLNDITKTDAVLIDSLKAELEIEIFEKQRYVSIVEQVSEVNCKEVKEIIDGTE